MKNTMAAILVLLLGARLPLPFLAPTSIVLLMLFVCFPIASPTFLNVFPCLCLHCFYKLVAFPMVRLFIIIGLCCFIIFACGIFKDFA